MASRISIPACRVREAAARSVHRPVFELAAVDDLSHAVLRYRRISRPETSHQNLVWTGREEVRRSDDQSPRASGGDRESHVRRAISADQWRVCVVAGGVDAGPPGTWWRRPLAHERALAPTPHPPAALF